MGQHTRPRPTAHRAPADRSRSRLLLGAVMTGALAVGGSTAAAAPADDDTDSAVTVALDEKNGSGVTGTATYGEQVQATASGLDPSKEYYSFVYGAGSDADGDNPCILTGELLGPGATTVGEWDVDEDGNGTLSADAPVPADQAGALSIREDVTGTGGNLGPTPVDSLVACGDVGTEQVTTPGTVQDQLPQLPSTSGVTKAVPDVVPDAALEGLLESGDVDDDGRTGDDTDGDGVTDGSELAGAADSAASGVDAD